MRRDRHRAAVCLAFGVNWSVMKTSGEAESVPPKIEMEATHRSVSRQRLLDHTEPKKKGSVAKGKHKGLAPRHQTAIAVCGHSRGGRQLQAETPPPRMLRVHPPPSASCWSAPSDHDRLPNTLHQPANPDSGASGRSQRRIQPSVRNCGPVRRPARPVEPHTEDPCTPALTPDRRITSCAAFS